MISIGQLEVSVSKYRGAIRYWCRQKLKKHTSVCIFNPQFINMTQATYLKQSVEVHEDWQNEAEEEKGQLGSWVGQPIHDPLHSARLLAVLVAGEVGGQSRVLGQYPLNDTLQGQPAGRAVLQQLQLVHVGELLKLAVELPSLGTENTGTKSCTMCMLSHIAETCCCHVSSAT